MRTVAAAHALSTIVVVASVAVAQPRAPSREALARAVRRWVAADASVGACRSLGVSRGEHQYSCSTEACTGACRSTVTVTVLGFRGERARVVSRESRRGADTGRCGCCASAQ